MISVFHVEFKRNFVEFSFSIFLSFCSRLNKDPPQISFKKKEKGGINLQTLVPQSELDLDMVKTVLNEYRVSNADVVLKYDATVEDFIDVVEGNRIYIPCIYVLNKIDQISIEELVSDDSLTSDFYVSILSTFSQN